MTQTKKYDQGASNLTSVLGPRAFTKAGGVTKDSESRRLEFISR